MLPLPKMKFRFAEKNRGEGAVSGWMTRHRFFFLAWMVSLAVFWTPLRALVSLSIQDYRYSHIVLIPVITACLIYWKRKSIFIGEQWCPGVGVPLLASGAVIYGVARLASFSQGDRLSVTVLAIVVVWTAAFVLCYGLRPFRAALFPLLFLLLFVPAPSRLLDAVIVALQTGSTEITGVFFRLVGMTALRDGYQFSLPGVTIEIAKECSSIRSGTALFITGLLAGYAFIRSLWRRAFLSVLTIFIAMFTNAVRIVTLCWLAVHVDRSYLEGSLHHNGGALFSLISIAVLIGALFLLSENRLRLPAFTQDDRS
jgi:exosortase